MKTADFNTKYLDKFLNILYDFDDKAKKYVIEKLKNSLKKKPKEEEYFDIDKLYGAWDDPNTTAEELIEFIKGSRRSKGREILPLDE